VGVRDNENEIASSSTLNCTWQWWYIIYTNTAVQVLREFIVVCSCETN